MIKQETTINFSMTGLLKIVVVGLLLFFLYEVRDLILVLLTAIVIASFVESTNQYLLKRFRIPRSLSIGVIYVLLFLVLGGIFYLIIPVLIKESAMLVSTLSQYFPELVNGSGEFLKNLSGSNQLSQFSDSAQNLFSKISGSFLATLVDVFGGLVNFILIIVISFYLSIQERGIEKFLRIVTPAKHEIYIINLWERTQRKITLWVRGQMILGIIVGVITYIALAIAGVPYALIFALLTAVMELIPFGVFLAAIPAVAVGLTAGGFTKGLIVAIIFIALQQLENYILQPLVLRRSVGISPLIVIISVLAGAKLAGFWGVILAIPVAVAVLEYLSDVEEHKIHPKDVVSG